MNAYHHLSTENAERPCGACNERRATAYVHETRFRCGECADVPESRREHGAEAGGDTADPRRNGGPDGP